MNLRLLHIGHILSNSNIEATLEVKFLNRHIAVIGSSGSGKTTLSKVIIEELLLQGYSSILIDPQGDLCSLMLPNDETGEFLLNSINFKIFTPGSKKGIPMNLNLFESVPPDLLEDDDFVNSSLDHISTNILNTIGIEMKHGIPPQKPLLEFLVRNAWKTGDKLTFLTLAKKINEVDEIFDISTNEPIPINQLITQRERQQLAQKLTSISTGTEEPYFRMVKHLIFLNF